MNHFFRRPEDTVGALLVAAFVVLGSIPLATPAFACSCIAPGNPYEELQRSDLVFVGRVLNIEHIDFGAGGHFRGEIRVRFESIRTFGNGDKSSRVTVRTATSSAACGFRFEREKHYIVYANEYDGVLSTNICTRTARLRDADEDLEAFNAEDLKSHVDDSPRCGGITGAAAIQSALLVVGFALLQRRRREDLYLFACRENDDPSRSWQR